MEGKIPGVFEENIIRWRGAVMAESLMADSAGLKAQVHYTFLPTKSSFCMSRYNSPQTLFSYGVPPFSLSNFNVRKGREYGQTWIGREEQRNRMEEHL